MGIVQGPSPINGSIMRLFKLISVALIIVSMGCQDEDIDASSTNNTARDISLDQSVNPSFIGADSLPTIDPNDVDSQAVDGGLPADANGRPACAIGSQRCGANSDVERCEDADGDGQGEWRTSMLCPLGQMCRDGECQSANGDPCAMACDLGNTQCAGELIQDCVRGDQACPIWTDPVPCPSNRQCQQGQCSCEDECAVGTQDCIGDGYRVCIQMTDCARWSDIQACPGDRPCENGECGQSNCAHECDVVGLTDCIGDRQRQCVLDDLLCRIWVGPFQCPGQQTCLNGGCSAPPCNHECPVVGFTECLGDQQRRCINDINSCRVWQDPTPCPGNFVCLNGLCSRPPCEHECIAAGQTECVGDQQRQCQLDNNFCRIWGDAQACFGGRVCRQAGCVFECDNQCDFVGQTRCRDDQQIEQCSRDARTQCLDWQNFVQCAGNQVCRDGRCFIQ